MPPTVNCGFGTVGPLAGSDRLVITGPTLLVNIGFDSTFNPTTVGQVPVAAMTNLPALVDTGATISCIDSGLAMQLNLPIVDRQKICGSGGEHEVNMHLAQIHVPALNYTIYGSFAAVDLIAGGQGHHALIGRSFLRRFTMIYNGVTGEVTISS
jgi:predicted aspartyl protease